MSSPLPLFGQINPSHTAPTFPRPSPFLPLALGLKRELKVAPGCGRRWVSRTSLAGALDGAPSPDNVEHGLFSSPSQSTPLASVVGLSKPMQRNFEKSLRETVTDARPTQGVQPKLEGQNFAGVPPSP